MISKKYLQSGLQTKSNEKINLLTRSIKSSGIELIFDILKLVHNLLKSEYNSPDKLKYFRQRTAEEIINSKISYGCTDYALVTLVLLREKNMPAVYVEAFRKKWLQEGGRQIDGHIFIEVEVDGHLYIINPEAQCILKKYINFVPYKKGFDSWDIGIKNFDNMKEAANEFRKQYNK